MRMYYQAVALGLPLLVCGCAKKPPNVLVMQMYVPTACIEEVTKGPETACQGPDMQHLMCTGIHMTKHVGCEEIKLVPPGGKQ